MKISFHKFINIFSNLILQWGSEYSTVANYIEITFPIAFTNNNYFTIQNVEATTGNYITYVGVTNIANTGCKFWLGSSSGGRAKNTHVLWFAIGY